MKKRGNRMWMGCALAVLLVCLLVGAGYVAMYHVLPRVQTARRDALRPTVVIFSPQHGAEVASGGRVVVQAQGAARGDQVVLMQLWADGVLRGEQRGAASQLSATWTWVVQSPGSHTLTVRAYNGRGDSGVAMVRVNAVEAADADADGVSDAQDDCPQQPGLLQMDGCPPLGGVEGVAEQGGMPQAAEGAAQEDAAGQIGWVAPEEELSEAEGGQIVGAAGSIQGEQQRPAWGGSGIAPGEVAIEENCAICRWLEDLAGGDGLSDAEVESGAAVELEVLSLRTAGGLSDVACYVRLQDDDWQRAPSDQDDFFAPSGDGFWNIAAYLGGEHGRAVVVPAGDVLRLQVRCLGRLGDMLTPSLHLGELIREHGAADWNGETFTARAQQDANWFDLSYRICAVPCEQNVIPPPYQLTITRNAGAVTTYTLAWRWDGNPADIDGFNIYRNGALVDFSAARYAFLSENTARPQCSEEYRFEVRAVKRPGAESAPSNPAFSPALEACRGRNELEIANADLPTPQRARLRLELNYWYDGSQGSEVQVVALPLQGGQLAGGEAGMYQNFSFSSAAIRPETGSAFVDIYYGGGQQILTDGVRLMMMKRDSSGQTVYFYSRDVPLNVLWYPSGVDLRIEKVDMLQRSGSGDMFIPLITVRNSGYRTMWWRPEILARRSDGSEVMRLRDGHTLGLTPGSSSVIPWLIWREEDITSLGDGFEIILDPDNVVAELDEGNNLYRGSLRRVRMTLTDMDVKHPGEVPLSHLFPDTSPCFVGLGGVFQVWVPGRSIHRLAFHGGAHDEWIDNYGENDLFECHEEGLMIDQDYSFRVAEAFAVINNCSPVINRPPEPIWFNGRPAIYRSGTAPRSGWMSDHEMGEWCTHLAQQGFAPQSPSFEVYVQPDYPLNLYLYLYDLDVNYDFWAVSCEDEYEEICTIQAQVQPQELLGAAHTLTLGQQSRDGCSLTVQVEEVPLP
ncbi:MAG: Ig-like domain-containing protein [Anaerolineae bacterium]|nr:Ig-like domain-containing protein [Anaerolineae bacterium]